MEFLWTYLGYIGFGFAGFVAGVLVESRLNRQRARVRIIGDTTDPLYIQQHRNQIDVDEKTAKELIDSLGAFVESRQLIREIEAAKRKGATEADE